jgi:SNF2 family DNA or RNA helicase
VSVGTRPGKVGLPMALRSTPKPHQEVGIQWLQRHWTDGSRGALLCDDMGLGKTYQALAFCSWLRELMEKGLTPRKPLLIVAPVGLLRNWEIEAQEHLFDPGLGQLLRAYGSHLRELRRGRHIEGTAALDTSRLARADVVLANYEAVADYQLSFGSVPFATVVFDEAQKIKSPKARMTAAAQGLNADFFVAMTGTPVENRLADLWCIADTVQPGALSDLKEFSARFETESADVAPLRDLVWQDETAALSGSPKLLLRRLKTDKLEGLPPKHEHVVRRTMPARQLEAYTRAVAMKEMIGPEGTLGMIHALRRISLHPVLAEGGAQGEELRSEDSARLAATLEILDGVAQENEKALVFLESLDLQEADQLPLLLQRRFGLPRLPMIINGEVDTEARQARVQQFQRGQGFDVMLLSPKAGGVGLTLTAANHVIHLSRWWNPAVEDQCSDRVYRIGQTKPVHIHYPLAVLPDQEEASFDVQLQKLMDRKRQLARNLLAAPAFTKQDYADLLTGTTGRVH